MGTRIFISYSHKDDPFRIELETHLAALRRTGYVEIWSDRKISAGQEWKGQIDENLQKANLILLLVSADFIASDYCYDVELKCALEMHASQRAIVVPVIVRPCDWKDSPFAGLQGLPRDALALSKWNDRDEGWLDVISALKSRIAKSEVVTLSGPDSGWKSLIRDEFYEWLMDTEVALSHRRSDKVLLGDIFVCPDLKVLDNDLDRLSKSINCREVVEKPSYSVIFGDEQSGKTTLSKQYFLQLLQMGWRPVIINGMSIKSSQLDNVIKQAYLSQYVGNFERFQNSERRAIIVDDYSSIGLNRKYQNKLVESLKREFPLVVIFAIDSFQYVVPDIEAFDRFKYYEILHFGAEKRAELIERWVSIGIQEEIDEKALYESVDELKTHLESFVNRNIVPPKPIYLLTLLQSVETITPQKFELTAYGHCYQYLIYQALARAKIKNADVDVYLNFLAELASAIFDRDGEALSNHDLSEFFDAYDSKYIKINREKVIDNLLFASVLLQKEGRISFKYRYMYYFHVAKKLAETVGRDRKTRDKIKQLLENLHKESCANIVIFLTHHTKDPWVLDEIQMCMMELFGDHEEAGLQSGDLEFMREFIEKIPKLVIEQRQIGEERRKADRHKDEADAVEQELQDKADKMEPTDVLAKLNRTFKGIELIGQVVRNRHGSLDKSTLQALVEEAYAVGLRFLQFFLGLTESARDEVIKHIENMLRENPRVDNSELEKEARSTFLLITYGVIYGILKKIAFSVGSKEAAEIYEKIEKEKGTPAISLISLAVELQFQKRLNQRRLNSMSEEFKSNICCDRILKEIVVQHLYMHYIDYEERQKIADILGLPVADQRVIGLQRKFKMSSRN